MTTLVGKDLGRYRLLSLLGEGGMGAVYKGEDLTLKRTVAVKVMHPHFVRIEDFRMRFLQEAQTAARMNHPGIVQVHDFGQEDDFLYIIMEFIPGANLQQTLVQLRSQKQWIKLNEAVEIVRQVGLALDYAHHQGVLHRDIKPGNIMLKPDPIEALPYRPVVTDLGLAKLATGLSITQDGTTIGTPAYMSPEQALGEKLDARSDVYSLGILLYELSVGTLPFPIQSISEAIRYHTRETPPLPRTLRPDLPQVLENIILNALEKDPVKRTSSCLEFANRLKTITPRLEGTTNAPTILEGSVSLVTHIQQSLIEQRGKSIFQEFATPTDFIQNHIQVLRKGKTTASLVTKPGTTIIGRDPECDIVLDDDLVSRKHARIEFDGTQITIQDLGSQNGTYLGDAKLLSGVAETWTPEKVVHIGHTWLRLVHGEQASLVPDKVPEGRTAIESAGSSLSAIDASVGIFLENPKFKIDPGASGVLKVRLLNQGRTVDHFVVSVEGIPPSWLTSELPVLQLMPGMTQDFFITISPPRSPRGRAGDYLLTVKATSQAVPSESAHVKANLTVTAFMQFSSDLEPQKVRAGRPARVIVKNLGNLPTPFAFRWRDRANEVAFHSSQTQVQVKEGQVKAVEFSATPRRRKLLGREQSHAFTVQVGAPTGETQTLSGELVSRGYLPPWVLPLFLIMCLLFSGIIGTTIVSGIIGNQKATQTAQAEYETQQAFKITYLASELLTHKTETASALVAFLAETSAVETARVLGDSDGDGLTNQQEQEYGTRADLADTDQDELSDYEEIYRFGTNPTKIDSDDDGWPDGKEAGQCYSPLSKDSDGDGLLDAVDADPCQLRTETPVSTGTPLLTATPPPTGTPMPTVTPTYTATPSHTPTYTPSFTPSRTLEISRTPTPTALPEQITAKTIGSLVRVLTSDDGGALAGYTAAFSPDNQFLAVTDGKNILIYQTSGWKLVEKLSGHSMSVTSLAFSPDGKYLASGSTDNTVRIWSVGGWSSLVVLADHTDDVNEVGFSPKGVLASGSNDRTIRFWSAAQGTTVRKPIETKGAVKCMAWSPDGNIIAAGVNELVYFYDRNNSYVRDISGKSDTGVMDFAYAPDGNSIAIGSYDGMVTLVSTSGEALDSFQADGQIMDVDYSIDGSALATATLNFVLQIWEASTGRELLDTGRSDLHCVEFSPNKYWMYTCAVNYRLSVWMVK